MDMSERKWKNKPIFFIIHAAEQFLQRKIPEEETVRMLKKGVHIGDPNSEGRMLCIYKEDEHKYYTIVYEEDKEKIAIITGFPSNQWDITQYKKVKKWQKKKA